MKPDRWRQIESLYHAALARPPGERAALLEKTCSGDEALRREVESLLVQHEHTGSLLGRPAWKAAAPIITEDQFSTTGDSSEPPKQVQTTGDLAGRMVGRFAVRARLGKGGMGEVYLADDTKLKRRVALKRVPPKLRSDEQYRRRLLREAEKASGLDHEHIAAIYDALEANGDTFLVMEYVEGVTLRERLRKPLGVDECLSVATQCVEALAAAHEKGIVHHDVKPENIMLTPKGRVKILDFGIAKHLPSPETPTTSESTGDSAFRGTPGYMAPEALLAKEPDARADIFSLGVVLYEALAGRHPFLSESFIATSDRILHETPPPLRRLNRQVPAELERIVSGMMAKEPAERIANVETLLADLRRVEREPLPAKGSAASRVAWTTWLKIAALAVLLSVGLAMVFPSLRDRILRWAFPFPIPDKRSVAVLPFRAPNGGAEGQAYCQGLGEAATDKLTLLTAGRSLQVMPPKEVLARGVTDAGMARSEFGANLVIRGNCSQTGNLVNVSLALVDTGSMRPLRSATIAGEASQPFLLHNNVVRGMTRMLELELTPGEHQAMVTHGTQVPGAYTYYVLGRGYLADPYKVENVEKAIDLFQRALELDRNYALAFAGLGLAFWEKYELTEETSWVDTARISCERAQTLDPRLAAAHLCVGTVLNGLGQYEKASAVFRLALEAEPTNDTAYRGLAFSQEHLGQFEAAEQTYLEAIQLRPQYWMGYNWLGIFYYRQTRYSDAAEMWGKMVALAPDSFVGYSNLGSAYFSLGRYVEAIQMYERSVATRPTPFAVSNLALAYSHQRRFGESARMFEKALKLNEHDYQTWGGLGEAYYWAPGERHKSAAAFRKAVALAKEKLQVNERDSLLLRHLAYFSSMLGEREAALAYLQRARTVAPHDAELEFYAAMIYAQFGDDTTTLQCLQKAISWGYSRTTILHSPDFDNLHENGRFQELMRQ